MSGSTALDIVIGLIFIYLLYSLLATILQEILSTWFNFRAKMLERAIYKMLEDSDKFSSRLKGLQYLFKIGGKDASNNSASSIFYKHPLIKFLGEGDRKKPAYITRETFSKILLDLLKGDGVKPGDETRTLVQESLDNNTIKWLKDSASIDVETLSYIKSIWADSQGDIEKFKLLLENWFDETMDRATGWYKKHVQIVLFFIGFAIAILFNVDTLKIVDKLETYPKLREQIVQQADAFVKAHPDLDKELKLEQAANEQMVEDIKDSSIDKKDSLNKLNADSREEYEKLKARSDSLFNNANELVQGDIAKADNLLGIGLGSYDCAWNNFKCFFKSLVGWLLTAIAISLGAPFWFDILNKLMKLRSSITAGSNEKQTQTTLEEKSIKRVG